MDIMMGLESIELPGC